MKTKTIFILLFFISLSALAQTNQQLEQQITLGIDAVDATLPQINMLMKKGEKAQAKKLVENGLTQLEQIEAAQKQLTLQNATWDEDGTIRSGISSTKRYLISKYNLLRYTNVYVQCDAKLFESDYPTFLNDVQSALSDIDVSFVDSVNVSDYIITLSAKAREYNKVDIGGASQYFVYVDAKTIIEKTSTGKRIQEKSITEKGGSPFSFEQAARDAYKKIAPKVSSLIKEQILK